MMLQGFHWGRPRSGIISGLSSSRRYALGSNLDQDMFLRAHFESFQAAVLFTVWPQLAAAQTTFNFPLAVGGTIAGSRS
jgi:hypothetical protein